MSFYSVWKAILIRMMCVNRDSMIAEEPPLYDDPEMETWFRKVCHMCTKVPTPEPRSGGI